MGGIYPRLGDREGQGDERLVEAGAEIFFGGSWHGEDSLRDSSWAP